MTECALFTTFLLTLVLKINLHGEELFGRALRPICTYAMTYANLILPIIPTAKKLMTNDNGTPMSGMDPMMNGDHEGESMEPNASESSEEESGGDTMHALDENNHDESQNPLNESLAESAAWAYHRGQL
eukprot:SAG31_NODE_11307_length_1043_cov_1.286017_2_plen_129_part_00